MWFNVEGSSRLASSPQWRCDRRIVEKVTCTLGGPWNRLIVPYIPVRKSRLHYIFKIDRWTLFQSASFSKISQSSHIFLYRSPNLRTSFFIDFTIFAHIFFYRSHNLRTSFFLTFYYPVIQKRILNSVSERFYYSENLVFLWVLGLRTWCILCWKLRLIVAFLC